MARKLTYKEMEKRVKELEKEAFLRKQIEEALRASEKKYRMMFESTQEAIITTDSDGIIISANPAAAKILGFKKPEELIGSQAAERYADLKQREKLFEELIKKGFVKNYELTFKRADGTFVDILGTATLYRDEQGNIERVEGFFSDICGRKRVEVALRESENNFRALAETANDGIVLATGQGRFVYANQCYADISGYSIPELQKMSITELADPDELEMIREKFQRRVAGEVVSSRYEINLRHKDGRLVPIDVTASRTVWKGQPAAMVIVREITARKIMEARLIREHDELERRDEERTLEMTETADQLERKHKELSHHKEDLEKLNRELVETNKALSVLARNIDRKREEIQKQIATTVTSKILPIIEAFQKDQTFAKQQSQLDILRAYLNVLTPDLKNGASIIFSLSAAELRVAAMIKNGLTSPQIAGTLHVSLDTVKTHRKNIRKKLNISNSPINLATYLRAKMG